MFAMSIGGCFFNFILGGCCLLYFVFKIIGSVDDDGEIKKTANAGIASWIQRWLK